MLLPRPATESSSPPDPRLEHHSEPSISTAMLPPASDTNGYVASLNAHDINIIEEEAGEKQNGTVNLNVAWDCAKHPPPKKTTEVAGQSLYIPPKFVCAPTREHNKMKKFKEKADRLDALTQDIKKAMTKKKFVGGKLSKRNLGSVMAIFASLTVGPCEVCA
jgi:hypothetical protein